jgi:hypothetical protein
MTVPTVIEITTYEAADGDDFLAASEPEDELRGLERDVELRAVADALELDPVGVR